MGQGRAKVGRRGDGLPKGTVINVQRYSIHDGPGIRTTVFLKGCPLRCFWCQNPESQSLKPEVLLDAKACTGCGRCVAACRFKAATLSREGPAIDRRRCTGCGLCIDQCVGRARSLAGTAMTVDEVLNEVLRDQAFYDNSGGGITLSGGDPTVQAAFSLGLLRRSKERGLHTAMETCGFTPRSTLERLLEFTNLVLFDLKSVDPARHLRATGKLNHLILDNLRVTLARTPARIRVPLIPGFNDTMRDVRALARFVKDELGGDCDAIDLLPYNRLGEGKYDRLDRSEERPSMGVQTAEYVEMLRGLVGRVARRSGASREKR